MGQTLACCSTSEVDNNDVKTNFFAYTDSQSPHFAALKLSDRIALVIRLQAAVRGFLARKRVRLMKDSYGRVGGMMANFPVGPDGQIQLNYDNPDVI